MGSSAPGRGYLGGMTSRALNGLAAAAVAVGLAELIAAPFGSDADALNAVGSAVIDLTPGPLKEWAIRTFGTADKLFLSVMMLAVIAALAAEAGRWETPAKANRQRADRRGRRRRVRGDSVPTGRWTARRHPHRRRNRVRDRGAAGAHYEKR